MINTPPIVTTQSVNTRRKSRRIEMSRLMKVCVTNAKSARQGRRLDERGVAAKQRHQHHQRQQQLPLATHNDASASRRANPGVGRRRCMPS